MQENTENILSINERIIQFIDYLKVSRYKFSQITGISESVLLNIYKGNNKPSVDFLEKILHKYPVLNSNWLLIGNGKMICENQSTNVVGDVKESYLPGGTCEFCSQKDDTIKALNRLTNSQQKQIDLLDARIKDLETSPNSGQKRKAG